MPTYQYACTQCNERLEVVQSFSDEALTTCPACSGRLRKVFSAVGVVFKGSGFYKTDSRSSTAAKSDAKSDGAKTDSAPKTESSSKADSSTSKDSGSSSTSKPAAGSTGGTSSSSAA